MKMETGKNKGFTLVEVLVVILIVTILAGIAIPVTLSIIDSTDEIDVATDANTIWNATQTQLLEQLANDQHWISTKNGITQGMILDQFDKNYSKGRAEGEKKRDSKAIYQLSDFENNGNYTCYLYAGYTVFADKILNKIENKDKIEILYIGAGKYSKYFIDAGAKYNYPYTLFSLVYKYKDDDTVYYYDGKNVSDKWIFKTPGSAAAVTGNETELIIKKNNEEIELQMYCIVNKAKKNEKDFANNPEAANYFYRLVNGQIK
jgi:prepilin-type N-terminal cleavage/methylation domain-containing protein